MLDESRDEECDYKNVMKRKERKTEDGSSRTGIHPSSSLHSSTFLFINHIPIHWKQEHYSVSQRPCFHMNEILCKDVSSFHCLCRRLDSLGHLDTASRRRKRNEDLSCVLSLCPREKRRKQNVIQDQFGSMSLSKDY